MMKPANRKEGVKPDMLLALVGALIMQACGSSGGDPPKTPDANLPENSDVRFHGEFQGQDALNLTEFSKRFVSSQEESVRATLPMEEYLAGEFVAQAYVVESSALVDERRIVPACPAIGPLDVSQLVEEEHYVRLLPSGQLVGGDVKCTYRDGTIYVAESIRLDICSVNPSCTTDETCGLVLAHSEPRLVHVECGPPGDIAVGEACAYSAPNHTNHDNCVAEAGCVDGVCRQLCEPAAGNACPEDTQCSVPDDLNWAGLGVCLPN